MIDAIGESWRRVRGRARKRAIEATVADPIRRIALTGFFRLDEVALVLEQYLAHGNGATNAWNPFADAHLELPGWFRHGLDPWSRDYADQQHRLWQGISGRNEPYEPGRHEREAPIETADPVRHPGWFARRDPLAVAVAAEHVIAGGMILKHGGLRPGDRALEYGAGFGQTALTLARLGVEVDTVDISAALCAAVKAQAEFFRVPLTAHCGRFGLNPRPGSRYRLIWFYESFHHCAEFARVVPLLREHLEPGGRVLLAGEPVVEREYAAVPYPWGIRLHSEVVAVVRRFGWYELGFSEAFLFELFRRSGFEGRRIDCEPSAFGRCYVFEAARRG